jgi:5-formyltetrahydrofolate cyclo-ligase
MQKATLRRLIRMRKHRLTQSERAKQSQAIMRLLEDHPVFQKARVILLYASLPDEVQTLSFIQRWSAEKQILLPVVVGDTLELYPYTDQAHLKQSDYGIFEPLSTSIYTEYAAIDLAIIPGIAFTSEGCRLGRGKGYYDRLLSHPSFQNVHKMGICFPFQLLSELPTVPHDMRMDEVLTLNSDNSTLILEQ